MKTKVINEEPAFNLDYSDYNTPTRSKSISWKELKESKVGKTWESDCSGGCGRDVRDKSAKLVYQDEQGCAVLFTLYRTTDEPNPVEMESQELVWFNYIR